MKDEQARKQCVRIVIICSLESILRDAKKANEYAFYGDCSHLKGALAYMNFVGDISFEDRERVLRLIRMISKKYKIF